jgi:tetratricopeptide (TPR) repeat protein
MLAMSFLEKGDCMMPLRGFGPPDDAERRKLESALSLYSQGLARAQDHRLHAARGVCLVRLGRAREAAEAAEKVLQAKPEWHKGHRLAALAAELRGRRGEADARAAWERAADLAKKEGDEAAAREAGEAIAKGRTRRPSPVAQRRSEGGE